MDVFRDALHGNGKRLRKAAEPDGVFCVAAEPHSVFLVQNSDDGTQSATVGSCGRVSIVELPRSFRVQDIAYDAGEFVLTSADGQVAHGSPDQFTAQPRLVAEEHNPRYQEQLTEIFLRTHQLSELTQSDKPYPPPSVGPELAGPELADILRVGQALVPLGEHEVWLSFDYAGPEKVADLLPLARELLADFDRLSRAGAELLWDRTTEGEEIESDRAGFLAEMIATSLVVLLSGDFELHYEGAEDFFMEGYWPSVQFLADRTPVDYVIEA
ncbi:hypothetical protein [Actinophytocola sp.]|uniref:hypothetical protein n=1 Tax=Actinophytocola sp. TaxID=1872138 RepID=UPI002ECFF6A4